MRNFNYRYFGLNLLILVGYLAIALILEWRWLKAHTIFQYFVGGMACSLWADYLWGIWGRREINHANHKAI